MDHHRSIRHFNRYPQINLYHVGCGDNLGLKRNIKPLQTISEIATSYENTLNWLLSTEIIVIIFVSGYYDKILAPISSELEEFISPYSYLGMFFAAGIFLLMANCKSGWIYS